MRKFKSALLLTPLVAGFLIGCKPASTVSSTSKKVVQPCQQSITQGDRKYFRASGMAVSQDANIAKERAILAAQNFLATGIQTSFKNVTQSYANERGAGDRQDLEAKYERMITTVVDQNLSGMRVICDELYKESDGRFTNYVAVELSADDLVTKYMETLSKTEKMQIDYDAEKFRKDVFDQYIKTKGN